VSRPPEFHDLFDAPIPENEAARLRRAHDLLVEAGPPAELPPWLEQPPKPWAEKAQSLAERRRAPSAIAAGRRRRSRRYAMLALAAAIATVAFFVGYTANGKRPTRFETKFAIDMHGTKAAPHAVAAILVGKRDKVGNWPMIFRVTGLKQLPAGGYYELFLTRHGKPIATCGTFRTNEADRVTDVRLNAPYDFRKFDGWIVTAHVPRGKHAEAALLRTGRV
jgi:hypothetical protein